MQTCVTQSTLPAFQTLRAFQTFLLLCPAPLIVQGSKAFLIFPGPLIVQGSKVSLSLSSLPFIVNLFFFFILILFFSFSCSIVLCPLEMVSNLDMNWIYASWIGFLDLKWFRILSVAQFNFILLLQLLSFSSLGLLDLKWFRILSCNFQGFEFFVLISRVSNSEMRIEMVICQHPFFAKKTTRKLK